MSGVYGNFISNFPELMETFTVWEDDETKATSIRGVYIPTKGGGINRRKLTSGNWALDIINNDNIYVSLRYASLVKLGMYFRRNKSSTMQRIIRQIEYDKSADYTIFEIEKVEGSRYNQIDSLEIKEAQFD